MFHRKKLYNKLSFFCPFFILLPLLLCSGLSHASNEDSTLNKPTIKIGGWDVYTDPENNHKTIGYQSFEKKYNVNIQFTPFATLDNIIEAAESSTDFDIIIASNEGIHTLNNMGLVKPLDLTAIPHYKNLLPQFKSSRWTSDSNNTYAAPWAWGPTGLLYNTDVIPTPDSWNILWDKQYKGQIALWDDISLIWITALALGYDNIYNLTRQQLSHVKKKLLALNNQVIDYYQGNLEAFNMIRHHQPALLNSWFDPSARLRQHGRNYKLIIPAEGAVGMFDSFLVTSSTNKTRLAHQFINHQLAPEIQLQMSRITGLSPANEQTRALLDPKEIADLQLDNKNYFDRMLLWDNMPRKHLYEQVLAEVRHDAKSKPGRSQQLNLSTQEQRWIQKNPVIKFTGDPNWLPYEAFKENGEYIGIVADHLKLIESLTGLQFETIPTNSWTESLNIATEGHVSIISGDAADAILNKRFKPVDAYSHNSIVIIMDSRHNYVEDLSDIKNKKIAIIKDYGYTADIFKTYPDIDFIEVENIQEGLLGVSDNRFDAMLATLSLASYTIAEMGIHNIKIVGKTPIIMDLTLFIDNQQPILHSIINKSLKSIDKKQSHKIIKQWSAAEYIEKTDYSLAYQVGIGAVILIAIFTFWNRRLSREIELRIQTEKEIESSQARFEAMFESIPDAIIYADPDRNIRLVNNSAIQLFGYTKHELFGHKTKMLYASADDYNNQGQKRFSKEAQSTASLQTPYNITYKTKSGREFLGETLGIPVVSVNNDTLGYLGIIRDITDRTHVDAILRSLAATSSAIEFNSFLQTILKRLAKLYDCKFAFVGLLNNECNKVETLSVIAGGKTADNFEYDLQGTPCKDVMDKNLELIPHDAARLYPDDELLLQMGIDSYFGAPLISSDKNVIGILSVMDTRPLELDRWTEPVLSVFASRVSLELERNLAIEELKTHHEQLEEQVKARTADLIKARDEAEKANATKSEFLSRMSHELRTPMNAILGFGQILEYNASSNLDASDLKYVNEVLKGGYHLLDLINEVLDLSRVESGDLQLNKENIDFIPLVKESISLIQPLADKSGISIAPVDEMNPIMIYSDKTRVKQVLLNLLSNAVKYNCENGRIDFNFQVEEKSLTFHVVDTGPGIPESMQSRVFEPFDRLDADTSTIEGTGIGLSLAKKMSEMLGGNMGFTSVENTGSDFWVSLPLSENALPTENTIVEERQQKEPTHSDGDFTILYVEDNPANLRLVAQLLSSRGGITLHDAQTASLAFDLLSVHRFDMVLLDIHLPGSVDGYGILKKIRETTETKNLPVIAVSANATEHDIQQGFAAGFDEYLTKPININQFMKTIEKFLSQLDAGNQ